MTSPGEDVLQLLCHDVEYRLREILQDAAKFMRHAHRMKLTVEDVNGALINRGLEVCPSPFK